MLAIHSQHGKDTQPSVDETRKGGASKPWVRCGGGGPQQQRWSQRPRPACRLLLLLGPGARGWACTQFSVWPAGRMLTGKGFSLLLVACFLKPSIRKVT